MQLSFLNPLAEPETEILTDSDQRYTKPADVAKCDRVLGGIGLDPTSNPQKTVNAVHHITEKQDCFLTDWQPLLRDRPTVFMNPPFSDSAPFIRRMCEYLRLRDIEAAITLTLAGILSNKSTQGLIQEYAIAVCHPFGRINFIGSGNSNDRDTVFILWGEKADFKAFKQEMNGLITRIER